MVGTNQRRDAQVTDEPIDPPVLWEPPTGEMDREKHLRWLTASRTLARGVFQHEAATIHEVLRRFNARTGEPWQPSWGSPQETINAADEQLTTHVEAAHPASDDDDERFFAAWRAVAYWVVMVCILRTGVYEGLIAGRREELSVRRRSTRVKVAEWIFGVLGVTSLVGLVVWFGQGLWGVPDWAWFDVVSPMVFVAVITVAGLVLAVLEARVRRPRAGLEVGPEPVGLTGLGWLADPDRDVSYIDDLAGWLEMDPATAPSEKGLPRLYLPEVRDGGPGDDPVTADVLAVWREV